MESAACVKSKIENLSVVEERAQELFASLGLSDEIKHDILICIDEAFSNIVFHGYKNREDGDIAVAFSADDTAFTAVFTDHAAEFTPAKKKPKLGKAVFERTNLGIGVYLMRKLMDTVHYERIDGGNRLTLVKKLKTGKEQ